MLWMYLREALHGTANFVRQVPLVVADESSHYGTGLHELPVLIHTVQMLVQYPLKVP